MARVRRLTEEGRTAFRVWIEAGAQGEAPRVLLTDAKMSEALDKAAEVDDVPFATRLECGRHLASRLGTLDRVAIRFDAGLWDWLSLFYIDQTLPNINGTRKILRDWFYCLQPKRLWYRHYMLLNWLSVVRHGDNAKLLLTRPMNEHGNALENLASRQDIIESDGLIAAANLLYWDEARKAAKVGYSTTRSRGRPNRGIVQRFGLVTRQLALTWDFALLDGAQVVELLPREFERWKLLERSRIVAGDEVQTGASPPAP